MAYLHCHTKGCGWQQDDFWKKDSYTPFRQDIIEWYKENLFKDKVYLQKDFFEECPELPCSHDEKGWYCKGTDYVAWDLEKRARRIRNMNVRTWEEWKEVCDTWKCPKCGQSNPDID